MSVLEELLFEKFFGFLWKVIKLVGTFIKFPFVNRQYSLEQLSIQNLSGAVGIIFLTTLTTLVFLLVK